MKIRRGAGHAVHAAAAKAAKAGAKAKPAGVAAASDGHEVDSAAGGSDGGANNDTTYVPPRLNLRLVATAAVCPASPRSDTAECLRRRARERATDSKDDGSSLLEQLWPITTSKTGSIRETST